MKENESIKKFNWDINYGELSKDTEFVTNCDNLVQNLKDIQEVLDQVLPLKQQYDKLPLPAQIELDLFLAFTLNSLYWVHLRMQGIDPMTHPIKDELQRIKAAMLKWQQAKDRDKRPIVNIEAAKRFVRSGLYDPSKPTAKQNKKIKFDDNSE